MAVSIKPYLLSWWRTAPIIVINVAVFVVLFTSTVTCAIGGLPEPLSRWVSVPPTLHGLLFRPWTVITYMFSQSDFMHLLFNMLWLYWFGQLFLTLCTRKQLTALYIYGGIGGAVMYITASAIMPGVAGGGLIGSSAAVIAIVIAVAFLTPDMRVPLLFIGEVKMKWLAIGVVALFVLGLSGTNAGGHVAHFGGALVGTIFGLAYRRGYDLTRGVNRLIDTLTTTFNPSKRPRRTSRRKRSASASQAAPHTSPQPTAGSGIDMEDLDNILDKIKRSGYTALTQDEKRRLFSASSRLKDQS